MQKSRGIICRSLLVLASAAGCSQLLAQGVGDLPTAATAPDGRYISWQEHLVDDAEILDFVLSGGDGLVMTDIDNDGFIDIVSVHESDSSYDSANFTPGFEAPPEGYVRIAFGSADPTQWHNITVAKELDAAAPEDAAVADVNGDGFMDILVAAELSHVLYLQNPGPSARDTEWPRLKLPMTVGRGSYIRVFAADLDGDIDIVIGTRGEDRLVWFDNPGDGSLNFIERAIGINGARMAGFNLVYADLSGDGRLDIIGAGVGPVGNGQVWIEQPARKGDAWNARFIGTFAPDSITGLETADINGDGHIDVFAGSYSRGEREADDANAALTDPLGRLGWFQSPGVIGEAWTRHDVSRRKRGMFDKFIAHDMDGDGDADFVGTRGNSYPYDGVFWLEQVRSAAPLQRFTKARALDSDEVGLLE